MANMGRAFSDVDLLVAAVSKRLGGVIVSADADFDALSLNRENWRIA
jgi:predicted nucleic acid-binding protein